MVDYKELYILGEPIDTDLGKIYFLKVSEYPELMKYIAYLELEKFEIINQLKITNPALAKYYKDKELIVIIKELEFVCEIYDMLKQLFQLCFKRDVFDFIETNEDFEEYKKLIRKMNCVTHEEKNPNPEIQYFNDLQKIYNQKHNAITFESLYSSVWIETGINPIDLTIYQLHCLFNRIGQFKNYDTTVLYSTLSSEVKIEPWFKHIDMFDEKKKELTNLEELKDRKGSW